MSDKPRPKATKKTTTDRPKILSIDQNPTLQGQALMNGYYSRKQKTIQRQLIKLPMYYLTTANRVVEVTMVGNNPPAFDDVFDLGPVMRRAYDYEIDAMFKEKDKRDD